MGRGLRSTGLATRLTLALGAGALLLSTVLALVAYGLSRDALVRGRERVAVQQAALGAGVVDNALLGPQPAALDLDALLVGVTAGREAAPLLVVEGRSFGTGLSAEVPPALRRQVLEGSPAQQRYRVAGEAVLAVGVPVEGGAYFEVTGLGELDRTLRVLSGTLTGAAVGTAVLGGLVGLSASRRLVAPVREAAAAAAALAGGRLQTRLPPTEDPDLGVLATSFNTMADALQGRLERDARFAADVSHELRSPLTTLGAAMSVMQSRREQLPPRSQQALDLLATEVGRFGVLVEDLLAISRYDDLGGGPPLDLEDIDLPELLRHVLTGLAQPATVLDVAPAADGATVVGDKRRLERVVTNLVSNAVSHGGGVTRVGLDRHGEALEVAVEDDGPGVEEADRERVFERFHRGSASGRRGGSTGVGLGLALVRSHVAAHGGTVHVEPAPCGGARFVVTLPAAGPS